MLLSPRLQGALLAFLVAIAAPGVVVGTDGIVHDTVNAISHPLTTMVDSTQPHVEVDMDKAVDRIIDRILR